MGAYGFGCDKCYNEGMFIVGILGWWYGTGWKQHASKVKERLASTMDYFSIDLLLRTLFAPFRQISAEKTNGSINMQMHAFFDRMISRVIGMIVRSGMIVIGTAAIIMYALLGCIGLLVWALVPLLPLVGVVLFATGWMPWIA